jgi:hypothetical protein
MLSPPNNVRPFACEQDLEEKGKAGRTLKKYVGSYEVSSEIVPNELQSNESNQHEKDCPVHELDDLWMGMSVALACSEVLKYEIIQFVVTTLSLDSSFIIDNIST